uniref:unspecific monooxygenase n=1 Tax=Epiphyas postvittana TaxID=65032 RepID=A0A0K8TV66_EPIPO
MDFVLLSAIAAIIGAFYYYVTRTFNYWKDRNVPHPKPVPLFGNLFKSSMRATTVGQIMTKIYKEYPKEKIVGVYRMTTPNVLLRDLDIVKHVMIKDFDNFADRGVEFSKEGLGKNLFHADGDTWRVLRNRFSPMFTNQKLKNMMYLLTDRADTFTDYVKEITAKNPEQLIHPLVQKYTMSTISACAFGLDVDTFRGEIETLKRIDRDIFTVSYALELDMMFPGLFKKLNMSILPSFVKTFFRDLVKQVINERNGQPTSRRDFMDLMLEMRNKQELQAVKRFDNEKDRALEVTDSVIEAQAFLFYAAGYETSASTMGFMLYHLALETDIQDKLRAEIDEYLRKNNNQITLETVMNDLPYLEQVFDETLRMYPIVETLQRCALEEYQLPGTDVKVAKNQLVLIPVLAIHHDEKYYPNPSKFDPERFTPDKVAARHSCAYLPFGVGPRHCIGMRFAQVQSRICIIRLLSKFKLEPSKNTVRSFQFDPYRGVLSPKGGFHVNIFPRNDVRV